MKKVRKIGEIILTIGGAWFLLLVALFVAVVTVITVPVSNLRDFGTFWASW